MKTPEPSKENPIAPSKRNSKQRQHGKALDSRSQVVANARADAKIGIPFYSTSPAKLAALTKLRDAQPGGSVQVQETRLEMALRRWPLTFQEMWALGLQDGRARIYGLRQRGLDITTAWVVIETDNGQRHRVGLYSLCSGGNVPAAYPNQPSPLGAGAVCEVLP